MQVIIEIAVGFLAVSFVIFMIIFTAIRKKKGKTGCCDCDCSQCHGCTDESDKK